MKQELQQVGCAFSFFSNGNTVIYTIWDINTSISLKLKDEQIINNSHYQCYCFHWQQILLNTKTKQVFKSRLV